MNIWVNARTAVSSVQQALYCDSHHEAERKIEKALREGKIRSRHMGKQLSRQDWAKRGTWPEDYEQNGNWAEKYNNEKYYDGPYGEDQCPLSLMDRRDNDGAAAVELHRADLKGWIERQGSLQGPSPKIATGKPGRPSAKNLVLDEHEARLTRGETLSVKREEARALREWAGNTHPDVTLLAEKTIANLLSNKASQK